MFAHTLALLQNVKGDRKGVTALEYGIMAGLIAGVIVVAVTLIGTDLNLVFGVLTTALGGTLADEIPEGR